MHRILILSLLLLSGCESTGQAQQRRASICQGYGFTGGPSMAQCMQQQAIEEHRRMQAAVGYMTR